MGDPGPSAPSHLYEKVELLEAHMDEGTRELNLSDANETGLTQAALDALVGIHGVHQRAFKEGQIPAAFGDSDYLHLAFREPTPVHFPLFRKGETRVVEHVYLIPNGTPEAGNVVLDGPTRGEFTSDYDEDHLWGRVVETLER